MPKRVHISLIHGTFARNAEWTEETSAFCKSIVAGLDINATFSRPQWSGRNSTKDRIAAADELAASLSAAQLADPDCLQIAIGHSHGGSVLAYALARHPELAETVAGVFLSTPFIDARPRRNWLLTGMIITLTIACTSMILMGLAEYGIVVPYLESFSTDLAVVLAIATNLPLMFLLFFFTFFWAPRAIVKSNPKQLARNISTCRLPEGRYLFLRVTGDEASSALATTQFTAWLFSKFVQGATAIVPARLRGRPLFPTKSRTVRGLVSGFQLRLSVRLFIMLTLFSSFFIPPLLVKISAGPGMTISSLWGEMLSILGPTPTIGMWLSFLTLIAGIVASVVAIALFLLVVTFFLLSWFSHRALGGASFKAMMFLEMAVELVPIGVHTVVHTTWAANYRGLTHSLVYQNPNTIAVVRTWIASIAKS
jgi:hypothetical protein